MDFTDVALMALQVVSPVLVAALTWAAAKLASFIRSKVDNEYLRGVLVEISTDTCFVHPFSRRLLRDTASVQSKVAGTYVTVVVIESQRGAGKLIRFNTPKTVKMIPTTMACRIGRRRIPMPTTIPAATHPSA
jgi:hypothetical protein